MKLWSCDDAISSHLLYRSTVLKYSHVPHFIPRQREGFTVRFAAPQGFRDIVGTEARLRETTCRAVQDLLSRRGYALVETPTLEKMTVMQAGGRMPASPFKFFDAQGELVTMRPDVTVQVARLCAARFENESMPVRLRYQQRVFREAEGRLRGDVREKMQVGVELIGSAPTAPSSADDVRSEEDAEVIELFVQALETAGARGFTLSLATVAPLRCLLRKSGADPAWCDAVLSAFHESNFVEINRLAGDPCAAAPVFADTICALSRVRGGREAIARARSLVAPLGCAQGLDALEQTFDLLAQAGVAERIAVDFSVMSSFDYYTGIVFEAFAPTSAAPLGSGGRYDNMLGCFGASRPAAGFAFYLEEAMGAAAGRAAAAPVQAVDTEQPVPNVEMQSRVAYHDVPGEARSALMDYAGEDRGVPSAVREEERPLRIAVPKGSLNADAIRVLVQAGLDVDGLADPGRQLIIRRPGVEYVIVRPSDAPAFVEMGAADCGICGKDSLIETGADVMELVDLGFGACRFVVAVRSGALDSLRALYARQGFLRVATKYPRIAQAHFDRRARQVEIVKLNGNIELGPLTGLSDCIVDITATGRTLEENDLEVADEVLASTARFFANAARFRIDARVRDLAAHLSATAQMRGGE